MKKLLALALCALTLGFACAAAMADASITFQMGGEPECMDPTINDYSSGSYALQSLFRGLYKYDADGALIPAMAESYEVSEDGCTYTFKLKEGLKWSDGRLLTAHDFEYSWKRVLNPDVGSETAYTLYSVIKDGYECFVSKTVSADDLPIRALEQSGANLCYVTPSHHFPTGVTMPAPRRAQLLAWAAAKPGRFILEDDYDSEFRFATRPLPSLQGMSGANGPVVYLTTFSKSLAPGMRIACMVLPQGLLERYQSDFSMYANTVSRYEQQTLCEFMANGYFARHIARMRLTYKRRMEAFAAALHAGLDPDLTLAGAHSGLHFLLTLPGAGGEQAMVQAAAKQGVRLKGLSEYYMQDAAHCRPDTVVAGYSGLQAEDIPAAAAALGRAWRQMSHSII